VLFSVVSWFRLFSCNHEITRTDTKWRCGGALPPAYAGSSAFALLTDGRRQLFDDSMRGRSGVIGIFLIMRGFLENTWFS
jgi:hypothetical protein